jgi:hypothetical protein
VDAVDRRLSGLGIGCFAFIKTHLPAARAGRRTKLRRRQLTKDGNVDICGRNLRDGSPEASEAADANWRRRLPEIDDMVG